MGKARGGKQGRRKGHYQGNDCGLRNLHERHHTAGEGVAVKVPVPFIACTEHPSGHPVYLNVLHIVSIGPCEDNTQIQTTGSCDNSLYIVSEPLDEVLGLLLDIRL